MNKYREYSHVKIFREDISSDEYVIYNEVTYDISKPKSYKLFPIDLSITIFV